MLARMAMSRSVGGWGQDEKLAVCIQTSSVTNCLMTETLSIAEGVRESNELEILRTELVENRFN
jgi:hypothetical protein